MHYTRSDIRNTSRGIVPIVVVAVISVLVLGGVGTYVAMQSSADEASQNQESADAQDQGTQAEESSTQATQEKSQTNALSENVVFNPVLSRNSQPRAKVDIFWDYEHPEGRVRSSEYPETSPAYGPFVGIASPLHLVSSVEIVNNSEDTLVLSGVENEDTSHIDIPPKPLTRATPLMLLPDNFRIDGSSTVACAGRDITSRFSIFFGKGPLSVRNTCEFEQSITIAPGASIVVEPVPYLADYGKTGQIIFDVFEKASEQTYIFKVPDEDTFMTPKRFSKFDDVLEDNTPNIGGFFVTNLDDPSALNKIFHLKNEEGQVVTGSMGNITQGRLLVSYEIPLKVSSIGELNMTQKRGLQAFLHINGFLNASAVTGKIDDETMKAFKAFQRDARVYPTGELDEATVLAMRGYKADFRLYENYADTEIRLGMDSGNSKLSYWGIGTSKVEIDNASPSPRTVESWDYDASYAQGVLRLSSGEDVTSGYTKFGVLNNTASRQRCTIYRSDDVAIDQIELKTNTYEFIYPDKYIERVEEAGLIADFVSISCGGKRVRVNF